MTNILEAIKNDIIAEFIYLPGSILISINY